MLNLNSFMIGTKQPKVLAAFYENVLGKPAEMSDPKVGYWGWKVGSAYFTILDHSEMGGKTKDPGRMMFNFETMLVKEEFRASRRSERWLSANPMKWRAGGSRPSPTRMGITSS